MLLSLLRRYWYRWSHRKAIAETARMLANMENALPHPTLAQRLMLRYHYGWPPDAVMLYEDGQLRPDPLGPQRKRNHDA